MQVLVILIACRAIGWLGVRYLGQAQVTMEMLAGIILGPSVFGMLAPTAQGYLFPQHLVAGDATSGKHPSMTVLFVVAQLGLILYMFVVGLELDFDNIRARSRSAMSVSIAGILLPFVLGCGLYFLFLQQQTDLFGAHIQPSIAALYVGAAMCITAFPLLARFIYDSGLAGTPLGTLALASGATDDAAAWGLLSVVLAMSKGNILIAGYAIAGGVLFIIVCLTLARRMLAQVEKGYKPESGLKPALFGWLLLLMFTGALFTDSIGLHAVFGAFMIGVAMPKGEVSKAIQARIEPLASGLFLPFFFVFSGLNTKLGTLNSAQHWLIMGAVLVAAIGGKLGGCYAAARLAGQSHREAASIGILMNSRGLMGLIILNIGLQAGVITVPFYTIMALMSLVTTLMMPPLFRRVYERKELAAGG